MAKVELINLDRDTLNLMQSSMNDFCNEFDVNLGDNESAIIDFAKRFNDRDLSREEQ